MPAGVGDGVISPGSATQSGIVSVVGRIAVLVIMPPLCVSTGVIGWGFVVSCFLGGVDL